MKKFQTIYDFHQTSTPGFAWLFLVPVAIGVCIFIYNLFYGDRETIKMGMVKRTYGMIFGVAFSAIGLMMFFSVIGAVANGYNAEKGFYDKGNYKIIEGSVEHFHPMPAEGHDTEHFDVNSIYFDYSSFDLADMGYNKTQTSGGAIREGLYVRLWYATENDRNAILRIDTLIQ